jgi:hypothetical protein
MFDVVDRAVVLSVMAILAGCPSSGPPIELPSCDELVCHVGTVCLDGTCRLRECLDLECVEGAVCQPGPLCVPPQSDAGPACETLACAEGLECRDGMSCRPGGEDLDHDGVASRIDCDDGDPSRFPDNPEICDGRDNDCDGSIDEDARCREGQRCCGAAGCVVTAGDRQHCGACGQGCAMYDECSAGTCVAAEDPVITAVTPDPIPTGQWLGRDRVNPFIVDGEHMLGYASVFITSLDGESSEPPFEVVGVPDGRYYHNDQAILIDGAAIGPGPANLRVVRNDGAASNTVTIEIEGADAPVIDSVSPSPLRLADEMTVSVYGTGFWGQPIVAISPDAPVFAWQELPVLWVTDTWIRTDSVFLDPATNPPGYWIMRVINPDGVVSDLFPLDVDPAPLPVLSGLSPTDSLLGQTVTLEVFGFDFFGTPEIRMAPESSPEEPLDPLPIDSVDSRRLVTAPFALDPSVFSEQPYHIWVTNPDGASSNRLRFIVL